MKKVIIIGGGIAGLGAALKVKRAADSGADVDFVLLEKDDRLGGKIDGEIVETEHGTFIVDGGPDSFLNAKPAVHRIAKLTGIDGDKMPTDESRKKTLILSRGKLYEMPDGVMMFAPTKFVPFATTGLFSWPGKIRAGMDLFIPKKRVPAGERNDESLESFIKRRMGREILDRLAEPLVGGVHGSDPGQMSLAATFPNLLDMEQKHGNMIKGFLAQRKMVEEMKKKYPPDPKNPKTFFTAFKKGMHELSNAMADTAGRDKMRIGAGVTAVARAADGPWKVTLADGETVTGDAVILATESWAAEPLVRPIDAPIADALAGIPASSSATVSFAFAEDEIRHQHERLRGAVPGGREAVACLPRPTRRPSGPAARRRAPCCCAVSSAARTTRRSWRRATKRFATSRCAELRDILGINPKAQAAVLPLLPLDAWACRSTRWVTSTESS